MSKLIVMVGLPASGKSTYTSKYENQNRLSIVSTDDIRQELYGNPEIQDNGQEVFDLAYQRIEMCLRAGDTVVFDATNLKARNRKYLCKRFRPIADIIIAVYLDVSVDECIARDEHRHRTVGAEVIKRMAASMTIPRLDEGFDLIEICGKMRES